MARATPPIVANTDFNQWQSWEKVVTPDGSTTYYVIPGYNGQYVFDPFTSDATGDITIYNNPKPAYDAAQKVQDQQADAGSTSAQAAQIGGTVAGAGTTALVVDLAKNPWSETTIGSWLGAADKAKTGADVVSGGSQAVQTAQTGQQVAQTGSQVAQGTQTGAQIAQSGTQLGQGAQASQIAPQVTAQTAQGGQQVGTAVQTGQQGAEGGQQASGLGSSINYSALGFAAVVALGNLAQAKLDSKTKFMSEAQVMASNAIKEQVPGWESMSTGQRRAIINKASELGLVQGLSQHKTTVEHFNTGKGVDPSLESNAYFGFNVGDSRFSKAIDVFNKEGRNDGAYKKEFPIRKLLPGMGIAELAQLYESGSLEGVDIPGLPENPEEWNKISELNGFINQVKSDPELANTNVAPDTRDISEVARGQEATVYEIDNLDSFLYSPPDLEQGAAARMQNNWDFYADTLPGMAQAQRAKAQTQAQSVGFMGAQQPPQPPQPPQQPQQPAFQPPQDQQTPQVQAVQRPLSEQTQPQPQTQRTGVGSGNFTPQPQPQQQAQQNLPTYQQGVGPGTYKHPDGINTVTVDNRGHASMTLMGAPQDQSEEDKVKNLFADMMNGNVRKGVGKQPNVYT